MVQDEKNVIRRGLYNGNSLFCGGEATLCSVVSMQHEICYVVKCDVLNCIMCAGGTLRKTISQATEAWNRRSGEEELSCLG